MFRRKKEIALLLISASSLFTVDLKKNYFPPTLFCDRALVLLRFFHGCMFLNADFCSV